MATPEAFSAAAKARVLLVDDHALLRTGVANIINQEPDLRVVAEAGDGVEAIRAYERHQPDVTLLDLRMPVMEGVEVVRQIRDRRANRDLHVVTLSRLGRATVEVGLIEGTDHRRRTAHQGRDPGDQAVLCVRPRSGDGRRRVAD